MSAKHILKRAILFKNAVFDHKPEDMCCGGTMVRSECPYHKDQAPKHHIHHMIFRDVGIGNGISGSVISTNGKQPNVDEKIVIDHIPAGIGKEKSIEGIITGINEMGDHIMMRVDFGHTIFISGNTRPTHFFLWYPI